MSIDAATYSDDELWLHICQGHEWALSAIIDRYRAMVYTIAYLQLGDRQQSEEVMMDVFTRLWYVARSPKTSMHLKAYLAKATHNRAISFQRHASKKLIQYGVDVDIAQPAENFNSEFVQSIMAMLPNQRQQRDLLLYLKGGTYQEMSASTGRTLADIKKGIHRIFQALKKRNNI